MINPVKRGEVLEIYVDGASRGNPGPAAWACIFIKYNGERIYQKSEYIGHKTNNMAEYEAIINALKEAERWTQWQIKVFSDSQLVVRQINKEYKIKKLHLLELYDKVFNQCQKFNKVEFFNVSRNNAYIKECDALCNKCMDENEFKKTI